MTKTDQVATITQLEHEISQNSVKNSTLNLVDPDYDRQKSAIVEEDLLNNNEIKGGVLCNSEFESISESCMQAAAAVPDKQQKYRFFAWEFDHKLKWGNITGILIIHAMFVYSIVCNHPLPRYYQTYLWGKYFSFIFFSILLFINQESANAQT